VPNFEEGEAVGGILGLLGSIIVGGAVATVTVLGVVSSQTSTTGPSPADVSQSVVVPYGTNN